MTPDQKGVYDMPRTKHTTVYQFDELSDKAKERARDWFCQGYPDYDWWDFTYEDAERAGLKITEFDLGRRRNIKGHLLTTVQESCAFIMKDHGKASDTYKLAEQWTVKAKALRDKITDSEDEYDDEQEEQKEEYTQALLKEYFSILEKEYEWLLSDEQVDESIRCNEYEFTEDGRRA